MPAPYGRALVTDRLFSQVTVYSRQIPLSPQGTPYTALNSRSTLIFSYLADEIYFDNNRHMINPPQSVSSQLSALSSRPGQPPADIPPSDRARPRWIGRREDRQTTSCPSQHVIDSPGRTHPSEPTDLDPARSINYLFHRPQGNSGSVRLPGTGLLRWATGVVCTANRYNP